MAFIFLVAACVASALVTALVRQVMLRLGVVDQPKTAARKIHTTATPLGGGLAIYISFFLLVLVAFQAGYIGTDVSARILIGAAIAGAVLMIGGLWDDAKRLGPAQQLLAPVLASVIAIAFGVGLESITSPTGGVIRLNQLNLSIDGIGNWVVLADTIVFFWLMGMMFTTKFLDGLDGLVSGVVTIGAFMVFFVSEQPQWYQPEVGIVALIFAGACLGFLLWNFHPAKIFLGEGGSLFTGFLLGILALISGSKIATTLLVMGVPILDVARVIVMRLRGKRPIFAGDSEHLHFRLLHLGLSQRQAVLLFYSISLLFGMSTLFLQSHQKLIALVFLLVLMLLVGTWFTKEQPSPYDRKTV